ncbi:MAG: outer membrane protein assembly factor BamD [Alphaproteobacteria bacterium]|jgi:outer membrane protein assembly factor BamD|nr:outer membrane protein assembly factor BamD [Alphaproteobacteria bacterium]MBT4086523.1 outer membrane protein assembly factor BamD [Alphaproteobacteria bacterium]MBT4545337.1 outer membrane protein assembly factor BamD [Alphaproteobacteria bacterium]MBT7745361.1 outer membrane protein assembly factor BamD [Alphaproteobacteria bacterium]
MRSIRFSRFWVIPIAATTMLLSACSSDDGPDYVELPVDVLYNNAANNLTEGNYKEAAVGFDDVERQHPYSPWATRAQLMAAFAYYQDNEYDQAVIAAERFVQLHPGHKDTPYAFYLAAISYYEQIIDVGRDQKITELALRALNEVIRRYPKSEYSRDARLKVDLAHNHLAGREMEVGRFYQTRKQYSGAINRFRVVIEKYQTTSHVPEALHRLVETYLALGVIPEAQATAAVLGHNFPGSEWYQFSWSLLKGRNLEPEANDDSWISRTWNSLFD